MSLSVFVFYLLLGNRSVVPSSGPNVGGTLVTIMGSDLGVQAQDITVKLGEAICTVNTLSYLPG